MTRDDARPEFFIDRSLGRKHLAAAFRQLGLTVHTMASVYGEEEAQKVPDEVWLADAGARDWIVLLKDDAIRRRPAERDALMRAGVRAFCLTNAQLRAKEQTERFISNINRILQRRGSLACVSMRWQVSLDRGYELGTLGRMSPQEIQVVIAVLTLAAAALGLILAVQQARQ